MEDHIVEVKRTTGRPMEYPHSSEHKRARDSFWDSFQSGGTQSYKYRLKTSEIARRVTGRDRCKVFGTRENTELAHIDVCESAEELYRHRKRIENYATGGVESKSKHLQKVECLDRSLHRIGTNAARYMMAWAKSEPNFLSSEWGYYRAVNREIMNFIIKTGQRLVAYGYTREEVIRRTNIEVNEHLKLMQGKL